MNGMGSGTKNTTANRQNSPQKSSERKQTNTKIELKEMSPRSKDINIPKKDKTVKPTPRANGDPKGSHELKLNDFSRAPTGYFVKGDEFVNVDKNIKSYDAPDLGDNKKPD